MSTAVASLGMYDHPAQRAANEAIWHALAERLHARGVDAPARLDHGRSVEAIWRDPHLLLGQCCGYPLVGDPELALRVVARPLYDVPGCVPGQHVSHLIVRRNDDARTLSDYAGRVAAMNSPLSNTGCNLFRAAVAGVARGERFFGAVIETGSHHASVEAVRDGAADIAAVDAVTYAALTRYEPCATAGLRILDTTRPSPTLPFVTARSTDAAVVAALRAALDEVARDEALAPARATLFLTGIVPASIHRYVALHRLERDAATLGYPALH